MKTQKISIIAILLLINSSLYAQTSISLFNEDTSSDWHKVLQSEASPDTVFFFSDGILNAKGDPFGYIRTTEKHENYELNLEWLWVENATNSGVLLAITGEDTVWPHCIEAQLRDQSAGDLVLMHEGAKATVNGVRHQVNPDLRWVSVVEKFEEASEKDHGEWNHYRIRFYNGDLKLWVNGILQMSASQVHPTKGYIGLQSEGSWIQFRNITLTPLGN
ncbi:3-keto-disaccharide hydrolase [Alkalitalea saponilacus]|uniref:3-keto-alpha-glucoside-1,2-lyase/3-keto-2-hydroxy-glucal hydratase domain-containing protein n=1 Tax=Alkalitalea saponilacus TaxID=889453 RepID=A0A1T5HEE8_9BACT|nr:DUF1080 domain-containing protein [Alkalitalea saponilacus]ASB48069.1 hypothetical protein CDL62_02370 [Alkalitalea saponilacus]SKC19083.1 protein of unknown function [Alkalitalea saponilacus]